MKVSIIIPVYNEKKTIISLLQKVLSIKDISKQIIIVDDGSNDGSTDLIKKYSYKKILNLFFIKETKVKEQQLNLLLNIFQVKS